MRETIELSGHSLAKAIRCDVVEHVKLLSTQGIVPRIADVIVSNDPSVYSYVRSKEKTAITLGIQLDIVDLTANADQQRLERVLTELSADSNVHGIILELPMAPSLDSEKALACIARNKDIDGLTPENIGLVAIGLESHAITSATAQACIELAETQGILTGKHVGLVGRGRTVGRPLINMLINRNATVTVCHTRTSNLARALEPCDIVIVAIGRPHHIRAEHLTVGQIVIDAGINFVNGRLIGDVEPSSVCGKAAALTPVPGGVGPVTSAIIYRNALKAIHLQRQVGYVE